jgi:hypothetical protein
VTGTGTYLPLLLETLAPLNFPWKTCSVESGVPNGFINHLTPHLEGIIVPFSGEIRSLTA